ncbi:MAG: glycosyltransferase [Patescibacteria group bacterium]
MAKPFLSVIIPAYPATEQLPITLIDIDKHLSLQEYSYEIILVNGGAVQKFSELIRNLKLVESTDEDGYGALARQGMFIAKGNWRLLMDPRNIVSVEEFGKMLPYFSEDYEVLAGNENFLCFSETAAMQIFPLTKASRWAFGYETLRIAKKLKYKIKKVRVTVNDRTWPKFSFISFVNRLWEIIKINWRIRKFSQLT